MNNEFRTEQEGTPLERMNKKLAELNSEPDRKFSLELSIGSLNCDYNSDESIEQLLSQADQLMYTQKKNKGKPDDNSLL